METSLHVRAQMEQLSWQEKVKKPERPSTLGAHPIREKSIEFVFKEKRTDVILQTLKSLMTFGAFLDFFIFFVVITLNQE